MQQKIQNIRCRMPHSRSSWNLLGEREREKESWVCLILAIPWLSLISFHSSWLLAQTFNLFRSNLWARNRKSGAVNVTKQKKENRKYKNTKNKIETFPFYCNFKFIQYLFDDSEQFIKLNSNKKWEIQSKTWIILK